MKVWLKDHLAMIATDLLEALAFVVAVAAISLGLGGAWWLIGSLFQ